MPGFFDSASWHGHSFTVFGTKLDLLLDLADYDNNLGIDNQYYNIAFSAFVIFSFLWVVEYSSRFLWSKVDSPFVKPQKNIIILGRHTMDVVAMAGLVYAGFEALQNFNGGGIMGFGAMTGDIIVNGKVAAAGYERVYAYSSAAQRLCVFQIAYESKNFCDSLIHNDGALFLAHHLTTGIVSALATRPFLHLYSCFFLGWSEVSTVFLCVLVCFDDEHGLPGLNKAYPTIMTITGVLFAASFTLFRVLIWPVLNYYFWSDMWHIYVNGTVHSVPEWYLYMAISIGLSGLQIMWFKEIVNGAMDMLKNGGEIVIQRGDSDEIKSAKKVKAVVAAPKKRAARSKSSAAKRGKSPAVRRK